MSRTSSTSVFRSGAALLTLTLLPACATFARHEGTRMETQTVTVDEPVAAPDPRGAQAIPAESAGDDLLLGAGRMVANDGRWERAPLQEGATWAGAACASTLLARPAEPLAEAGVYRATGLAPLVRSWGFVGIALAGDGLFPAMFGGACGAAWLSDATGARLARLAPDVAGRDTSLLFTTARLKSARAGAGSGAAAVAVERPRAEATAPPAAPRTAKPRPAQDKAPAATAAAPAEPAPETHRTGAAQGSASGRFRKP